MNKPIDKTRKYTIRVLFFATLKDRAGMSETTLELHDEARVNEIRTLLKDRFPGLAPVLDISLVAVNREYASNDSIIPENAEIAFFPPVSGGADLESLEDRVLSDHPRKTTVFYLTQDELDLNKLLEEITTPNTGAACIFSGMVRGITLRDHPHETSYLEYEAYLPMAEAKMRQVAEEIREMWPSVEGIAIAAHRVFVSNHADRDHRLYGCPPRHGRFRGGALWHRPPLWDGKESVAPRWHLIARREIGSRGKIKYSVSNASETTTIERLAFMQGERYWVEHALRNAKSEVGMAGYQLRKWQGWYHHMTMVMLAMLFMFEMRREHKQDL